LAQCVLVCLADPFGQGPWRQTDAVDIATLIGLVVAGTLVISSILLGGSSTWFINYPSLMIVIGGTMGATLIHYPLAEVLSVLGVAKTAFAHRSRRPGDIIPVMVEFARTARREGILSFERELFLVDDPFLARGLQMAVDGMEAAAIEDVLTTEIQTLEERHRLGAEIFHTMGTFAPAMGMMGTIIGLIQMLSQMQDPAALGAPMAVALLTTFYGTVLAYLFFLPIAGKLRIRSREEMTSKQMALEGILAIQAGDNSRVVEQKLRAFLAPKALDKDEVERD